MLFHFKNHEKRFTNTQKTDLHTHNTHTLTHLHTQSLTHTITILHTQSQIYPDNHLHTPTQKHLPQKIDLNYFLF